MFPNITTEQRLAPVVGQVVEVLWETCLGSCEGVPEGVVWFVVVVCLGEVVNGLHQQGDLLVSLGGEVEDEMDHSSAVAREGVVDVLAD